MRGAGSTGKVFSVAAIGIALALWVVACANSSPVTVPEGSGETTEAVEPSDLVDDESTQEAQIRGLLEEFVEDGQSVGVVVGIVREGERVVVGSGRLAVGGSGPPDGDTVFEIGSITKVFTSTALADLEMGSGVGLETPVQSLLGDQVQMPTRNGTEITLGHLATHSSGLPRLPNNLAPVDWANPYAELHRRAPLRVLGRPRINPGHR